MFRTALILARYTLAEFWHILPDMYLRSCDISGFPNSEREMSPRKQSSTATATEGNSGF